MAPKSKRRKITPTDDKSTKSKTSSLDADSQMSLSTQNDSESSVEISIQNSSISNLPNHLLSIIIGFVPKKQWPSLELVNRSFQNSTKLAWRSIKGFKLDKDVLNMDQEFRNVDLPKFIPSILERLSLRSPMLSSISGFPSISKDDRETPVTKSDIFQALRRFSNLKRIDFSDLNLDAMELVEFLKSYVSRDGLKEIDSVVKCNGDWETIFGNQEIAKPSGESISRDQNRRGQSISADQLLQLLQQPAAQILPLELEKIRLRSDSYYSWLEPKLIDLIDPSSLKSLILINVVCHSEYLLALLRKSPHLRQLQFSFVAYPWKETEESVHLSNSKRILDMIPDLENLESLKIGLIDLRECSESDSGSNYTLENDFESDNYSEGDSESKNCSGDETDSESDNISESDSESDVSSDFSDSSDDFNSKCIPFDDFPDMIERLGDQNRLIEFALLHERFCTEDVIESIGLYMPSLKSLEVDYLDSDTEPMRKMIAMFSLSSLENLALNCRNTANDPSAFNHGITPLLASYMAIHLDLKRLCVGSPDHYVLESLTDLKTLEELCIIDGRYSRTRGRKIQFSQQLHTLDLRNCGNDLISILLEGTPNLRRLVLGGVHPIPEEIFQMIPKTCPQCELDASKCSGMTDHGIRAVLDGCPNLELLRCPWKKVQH